MSDDLVEASAGQVGRYLEMEHQMKADDTSTDRLVTAILQTAGEDDRRPNDRFEWYGSALEMAEGILAGFEVPADDSLDAAWAEAEALVPTMFYSLSVSSTVRGDPRWRSGSFVAATDYGRPGNSYAYADTPAAALSALAAKLRDRA